MSPLTDQKRRHRGKMSMRRRPLLLGLALVMLLGLAIYFRLWVIDYNISSADSELLRRQFDLAHREAVDESAEWRLRFDQERERATNCSNELTKVKKSLHTNAKDTFGVDEVQRLQKENLDLLERLKSLKLELETEKLKCKSV